MIEPVAYYMPSAGYFRREIHKACTVEDLREIALQAVNELEYHKEWIEEHANMIPPKRYVLRVEAEAKHMALLGDPDPDLPLPAEWVAMSRY